MPAKIHRGFTLIELLIVLLVLGILSGVTIFSTLDLASTADARKIINDMLQIKTATLLWYKNNTSRLYVNNSKQYMIKTDGTEQHFSAFVKDHGSEILKYIDNRTSIVLNNKNSAGNTGDYALIATDNARKWYVCCNLGSPDSMLDASKWKGEEAPDAKVRAKIMSMVQKFGLLGIDSLGATSVGNDYKGQKFVCIKILELAKR